VAVGVFRGCVARHDRAVDIARRAGHGNVHHDAGVATSVQKLPDRVLVDVAAVDDVPVVPVER
jgi:hypothetical protein